MIDEQAIRNAIPEWGSNGMTVAEICEKAGIDDELLVQKVILGLSKRFEAEKIDSAQGPPKFRLTQGSAL